MKNPPQKNGAGQKRQGESRIARGVKKKRKKGRTPIQEAPQGNSDQRDEEKLARGKRARKTAVFLNNLRPWERYKKTKEQTKRRESSIDRKIRLKYRMRRGNYFEKGGSGGCNGPGECGG